MVEIYPRKHTSGELTAAQNANQLDFKKNNFQNLFERFTAFIDASPNTIRTYRTSLRQWFKYINDNQIFNPTPDDVRQYKKDLEAAGKKLTTIQNYIVAVKRFFQWTEETRLYPDIAKHVKGEKISHNSFKKDYLRPAQAKKVLATIDRTSLKGKRDYAMLSMMLTMGLRTVEVSRANIENIGNLVNSTVLWVQGKGHLEADAPVRMPDHVEAIVREYLNERKATDLSEPLFTSTSNNNAGKRLTTRSISGIVKHSFIQAGFNSPKLTAHSTRHTTATLSLMNGATLQQTQQLLRHANMQTTEIYAHNLDASKNPAAVEVENAIFN